ncbi:uncharacterized protein LOC126737863 isoform X1 [Anthonomus grandis grandis]|uniref:uncharacterized protein LOC126737863 isoform X1 n=1 Tax=Anthonomus grandis grandis TaxID=2921223 RepID=UPI002164FC2D|nr:uncharacterized protein LOC126737863 isoform X1 [Anthonomus grandis grandis]
MDESKDSADDVHMREEPPTWEDVMKEKSQEIGKNQKEKIACDVTVHNQPQNKNQRTMIITENFINGEKTKEKQLSENGIIKRANDKSLFEISEVENKVNGDCKGNDVCGLDELTVDNAYSELTTKEKCLAACAKIYTVLTIFCKGLLIFSELIILAWAILAIVYVSFWGLKWTEQKSVNGCRKFYSPIIGKLEEAIVVIGYVTIVMPCLIGIIGAWFKNRKLLKYHNSLLLISLLIQLMVGFHFFRGYFGVNYNNRKKIFQQNLKQFYGHCEVVNKTICSCETSMDDVNEVPIEKRISYIWTFIGDRFQCTHQRDLKCFYDADELWLRGFWFQCIFFSAQVSALFFGIVLRLSISKYTKEDYLDEDEIDAIDKIKATKEKKEMGLLKKVLIYFFVKKAFYIGLVISFWLLLLIFKKEAQKINVNVSRGVSGVYSKMTLWDIFSAATGLTV